MCDSSSWKDECISETASDQVYLLTGEGETRVLAPLKNRRSFSWQQPLYGVLLSVVFMGFGILVGRKLPTDNLDTICFNHEQKWSPIQELDSSRTIVHFNGSFMKENVFRLPAGPEVDAAWDSLGVNYRALVVPQNLAAKAGLKQSQVQINPAYGGGYPANIEGLHHLHCLNLVRKALYYNIDYYRSAGKGAFVNNDFIVWRHVSHCLDIIRQQLMCTPNVGLLGQIWWDRRAPKAFVDFNTQHKCQNYDAIRDWAEKRQLPIKVPNDFLQPPKSKNDIYEELP
ncbi:putative tat pathway signal sequence [Erysiphe neolycopersici]|uniref:Putative tat pathway signal sequence n=1 Tax=Erysiphe neolycopersici TaxID=212602 RepID=A0A420HTR0_9PEZI|nr:putative tat pathway signal sequence [Erysiphe neolycopersici]